MPDQRRDAGDKQHGGRAGVGQRRGPGGVEVEAEADFGFVGNAEVALDRLGVLAEGDEHGGAFGVLVGDGGLGLVAGLWVSARASSKRPTPAAMAAASAAMRPKTAGVAEIGA